MLCLLDNKKPISKHTTDNIQTHSHNTHTHTHARTHGRVRNPEHCEDRSYITQPGLYMHLFLESTLAIWRATDMAL